MYRFFFFSLDRRCGCSNTGISANIIVKQNITPDYREVRVGDGAYMGLLIGMWHLWLSSHRFESRVFWQGALGWTNLGEMSWCCQSGSLWVGNTSGNTTTGILKQRGAHVCKYHLASSPSALLRSGLRCTLLLSSPRCILTSRVHILSYYQECFLDTSNVVPLKQFYLVTLTDSSYVPVIYFPAAASWNFTKHLSCTLGHLKLKFKLKVT